MISGGYLEKNFPHPTFITGERKNIRITKDKILGLSFHKRELSIIKTI